MAWLVRYPLSTILTCRQGAGPAALREPGPGQAISDTNVTWGSEANTNRTLSAEQQAVQAANCSGAWGAEPACLWWAAMAAAGTVPPR